MSDENTPFLADSEHEEAQHHDSLTLQNMPANEHFKRPLRILTAIISLLSVLVSALLVVTFVFLKRGPFGYTYQAEDVVKGLSIVLFINFILTMPSIFLPLPILLSMAREIAMGIVVLVFSPPLFLSGSLSRDSCNRYSPIPPFKKLPTTNECKDAKVVVNILMAVAGGVGILIGALIFVTLLFRSIALARTKFWKGKFASVAGWKPSGFSGFTVQFTFSVLPHGVQTVSDNSEPSSSGTEARLIDT